eukprot:6182302-Pleurochrysis_carterae.AAC.1
MRAAGAARLGCAASAAGSDPARRRPFALRARLRARFRCAALSPGMTLAGSKRCRMPPDLRQPRRPYLHWCAAGRPLPRAGTPARCRTTIDPAS